MVFRRFSHFDFIFWFHIVNSNFAKCQNSIKINIVQNLTKTSTILLHTNFPRPTNFIQFYSRALIVSVFIISPISPLNLQYLAIKFDKNQKIVLPFKIIIRDSYSSKKQNLWFLSRRNRDFWRTNYRKIRLFFFADPRRHRILVIIYTNIFIGIGANTKRTEIAFQYFRRFRRTIVSLFRDSHFYDFEPLCNKWLKYLLSHLARMREMKGSVTHM